MPGTALARAAIDACITLAVPGIEAAFANGAYQVRKDEAGSDPALVALNACILAHGAECEIHVYDGPDGKGYVLRVELWDPYEGEDGATWKKALSWGPEDRSHAWMAVPPEEEEEQAEAEVFDVSAMLILYVSPGGGLGWVLQMEDDDEGDGVLAEVATQAAAIETGRFIGQARERVGLVTEVRVQKTDGTFSAKGATYGPPGSDPATSAG